jgi:uncharacterized RDD family membrane protein YckC
MNEITQPPTNDVPPPAGESDETNNRPDSGSTATAVSLSVRRPSFSELALGGALIVGDNVGQRLQVADETAEHPRRTLEMVLRPAAEWDVQPTPLTTARHVAVGMVTDAGGSARRGGRFLDETSDQIGRALDRLTRPIRRSRPLQPVRDRFHRYQARGEQQLVHWQQIGRAEEARSRAVAEASLGGLVQQSVSDLTESEGVRVLVQHVVETQGTGLVEEILEEIRERMVSLDILLARRVQRDGSQPPEPPFRSAYIRNRPTLVAIGRVEETLAGHYAGFVSRTAAFFIDVTLILIVLSLATTFVNAVVGLFNLETILGRFMGDGGFATSLAAAIAGLAGTLFVVVYGVLAWSMSGATLGDILMGVRVMSATGERVSFGRAAVRMTGAYISGFVLFLGFIWALFDRRRQGWHDKMAGTVVIYDWPAVPDEQFLREQIGVRPVRSRQQSST